MPLYPLKCSSCGDESERFCAHSSLPEQRCGCGAGLVLDWTRMSVVTDRSFYGEKQTTSVVHQFHPSEVKDVRQAGIFTAGRIHDNGLVTFRNRGEERRFAKEMHEARIKYDPAYMQAKKLNDSTKARRSGKPSVFKQRLAERRKARGLG